MPTTTAAATPTTWSMRGAAVTAGSGLLLMAVLAAVGYGGAVSALVVPGDAARTATAVLAAEGLFRIGVVCMLGVVVLDVVVAWALYRVLRPVDPARSLLAAVLRFVYAAVLAVAVAQLAAAVDLLGSTGHAAAFGVERLHAQALLRIEAFDAVWSAGLGLFGVHLLVVGHLVHRSGYLPRTLGVLVAVAGAGYLFDSVADVLSGGTAPVVSPFLFAGEVLLAVWLLVRGRRLTAGD